MKRIGLVVVLGMLGITVAGCGGPKETPGEQKAPTVAQKKKMSQQYIAKGVQYLKQKDLAKAIQNFDMAIRVNPADSANYLFLAEIYLKLKSYGRAIDTLKAALRVAPDNADIYYLLAVAEGMRWEGKDRQEAVDFAKKSVALYVQRQDQEKVKRAMILLKGLMEKKK